MTKQRDYLDAEWAKINDRFKEHDEKIKFKALMSLECEFNKESLLAVNQCQIDESSLHIETCRDLKIYDVDDLEHGLEEMLSFKGVASNVCLQNIRKTVINSEFRTKAQLLALCNGEYDYQCPNAVVLEKMKVDEMKLNVDKGAMIENSAGTTVVIAVILLSLLPSIF